MRKLGAATATVLLLTAGSAWATFVTGSHLHEDCNAANGEAYQSVCVGYIEGVMDASVVGDKSIGDKRRADGAFEHALSGYRWCVPQDANASQMVAAVQKWLKANPETWHLGASGLVANALADAFPCK